MEHREGRSWCISFELFINNDVKDFVLSVPARILVPPDTLLCDPGMNIAELAHMEDEEEKDQDTAKTKLPPGAAAAGDKRASMDVDRRKSMDKSITLTRQAADANK